MTTVPNAIRASQRPRDPAPMDRGHPAQGHHERHRIEEVAVAVLEPAAAVVEQRRDQHEQRRARAATTPADRASPRATRTAARDS